jgi:peptidoglycan/LPS O-acetylase OafA/YrhL
MLGRENMKGKNEDTTNTTNTLKGIAISAVLMNHYLNLNVSRDYVGFGNLWISVFFILSGYGLSRSLDRRFETTIYSKELFLFYYERFIRIFPLLWLAWFIELIVKGGHLSPWILSGIHAKGHYWFIPALLQCYILSPWIYLGIRKKPFIFVAILITAFVTVNFLLLNNHIDHVIINLNPA